MHVISIDELAYHRNGVFGAPFYLIRFTSDVGRGPENFLATVFPDFPLACAVVSLDRIAEVGVKFGENSWRGDNVWPQLMQHIQRYEDSWDDEGAAATS